MKRRKYYFVATVRHSFQTTSRDPMNPNYDSFTVTYLLRSVSAKAARKAIGKMTVVVDNEEKESVLLDFNRVSKEEFDALSFGA